MNIKIAPILENIKANFWFVPTLLIILTIAMAAITITIDVLAKSDHTHYYQIIYTTNVEAIRTLLGTIAAAMITVTSIAFSITIVSLTLASSQFGPRLMRNFMMDRVTQVVLGVFISNFIYCIIIFCALSLERPYNFTPGITVIWAIAMTFVSVGFLIHFIHHVAKSIQADTVVDDVYCELKKSIAVLFPDNVSSDNESAGKVTTEHVNNIKGTPEEFHKASSSLDFTHRIYSSASGYVQLIDIERLLCLLKKSNVLLELNFIAGDYIVEGSVLGKLYAGAPIDQSIEVEIEKAIVLGPTRTPVQDPEFAVHQLVEIALRALSPSVNDPYTAMICVDKLSSMLCKLTHKQFPIMERKDSNGEVRLKCKCISFDDIATAAFNQIRQHAEQDTAVTIRLIESLKQLSFQARTQEQFSFISVQLTMISEQQAKRDMPDHDRCAVESYLELVSGPS